MENYVLTGDSALVVEPRQQTSLRPGSKAGRILGLMTLAVLGLLLAACTGTGPSHMIGFQGRLTDSNGVPVSGNRSIEFTLWTSSSGGTVVFTETQTVSVNNGLFNANIGSQGSSSHQGIAGIDPAFFSTPLWVQLKVAGETITPRQRLVGAPYAMSLAGGAVIVSGHEGNGAGGSDSTDSNYASLTVIAGSTLSGTALIVGHALNNSGDFIKACGDIVGADRDCGDPKMRILASGQGRSDVGFVGGGADLAELFLAHPGLVPGDVLVIGADGKLARSTLAYQSTVVGVYSTAPGFVANGNYIDQGTHAPVGLAGTLPVKVTVANGVIQPGDLLVASDIAGHAMRAGPDAPVGTIIGKALEGLNSGTGVISMLIMLR